MRVGNEVMGRRPVLVRLGCKALSVELEHAWFMTVLAFGEPTR